LRASENRVLRIFLPKRDEKSGSWRKYHDEELHIFYCASNIIRMIESSRMGWAEQVARIVSLGTGCEMLVGKCEWKKPLERPRFL
jgi:hypothetical protein